MRRPAVRRSFAIGGRSARDRDRLSFPRRLGAADVLMRPSFAAARNVTAGALRLAARLNGAHEINRAKPFTASAWADAGPDLRPAAAEVLAEIGISVDSVGRLRSQAPVRGLRSTTLWRDGHEPPAFSVATC